MGHPVQHRFMSLALEVCGGASVLERRLRSHFLGFLALLVACVPPSISGAGHATRGKRLLEKEGTKSQEIEIAVVGDDYSARASSNRPRAAACPLSSFQRTHSSLRTCLKSQNVRCRRRRSRFFLRMQSVFGGRCSSPSHCSIRRVRRRRVTAVIKGITSKKRGVSLPLC